MKRLGRLVVTLVSAFFWGVSQALPDAQSHHRLAIRLLILRQFVFAAMPALIAMTGVLPVQSTRAATAQVAVGAAVLRYVSIRVLSAPRGVNISQADIVQGYVDVEIASKLEIRSNSPTGFTLAIESQTDFAKGIDVRSNSGVTSLGRFGGTLNIQTVGHGMQTTPVELSFRILLSNNVYPGVYPWAPQITVSPS